MPRWSRIVLHIVFGAVGLWVGASAATVVRPFKEDGGDVGRVIKAFTDPKSEFSKHKFVVLLLGKDYNYTNKAIRYTSNSRTDTIMLLSVDIDSKAITAVSIPRDTRIRADDGVTGKINAVYTRGGLSLLKRTLEKEFDINIDCHVVLKPDAVQELVDAVGGVTVDPIDRMHYDDNWARLHIHFEPGQQRITGERAVGYVRFREMGNFEVDENGEPRRLEGSRRSKEEGDLRRTARQQEVIHSLLREGRSFKNIARIGDIIDVGFDQIETDLKRTQLMALGRIFQDSMGEMKSVTLPGSDLNADAYYYVLDEERAQKMVDWLINGDEAAGQSLVRVAVSNGTKVSGAAKAAADFIEERLGYDSWPRTAKVDPEEGTEVVYSKAAFEDAARKIKELIGAVAIRKDPSIDGPDRPEITIVIGDDIAEKMATMGREAEKTERP